MGVLRGMLWTWRRWKAVVGSYLGTQISMGGHCNGKTHG